MNNILATTLIENLWKEYHQFTPQMQVITENFYQHYQQHFRLDHFALIDLPSANSGIAVMKKIFSLLNFETRGQGFLADKQNDFLWMCENNAETKFAHDALPQVVVADFRLDWMPSEIAAIISKYADQVRAFPFDLLQQLINDAKNHHQFQQAVTLLSKYFAGRDWQLPTVAEFEKVKSFNELLAWVLVFGRRANHFTLAIHLQNQFNNLNHFIESLKKLGDFELNEEGGVIKGGSSVGIAQASTRNRAERIMLADGEIELPMGFVEFVWRYPINESGGTHWGDFYTGFIPEQANHVIESLYAVDSI